MSNIYEALEQAQRDNRPLSEVSQHRHDPVPVMKQKAGGIGATTLEKEMVFLYQSIQALLPHCREKALQIIGSQSGDGVSTVVRELALAVATRFGKKVLIIDAAYHNPGQATYFQIGNKQGWKEAICGGHPVENACYPAGNNNIFVSPISPEAFAEEGFFHEITVALLDRLKKMFDLIIIDSAPLAVSPGSIAPSRNVDGVVLVVEAEKTKWHDAASVRDRILKNGGTICGMVLNKRRFHIPERIYRLL